MCHKNATKRVKRRQISFSLSRFARKCCFESPPPPMPVPRNYKEFQNIPLLNTKLEFSKQQLFSRRRWVGLIPIMRNMGFDPDPNQMYCNAPCDCRSTGILQKKIVWICILFFKFVFVCQFHRIYKPWKITEPDHKGRAELITFVEIYILVFKTWNLFGLWQALAPVHLSKLELLHLNTGVG